MFHGFDSVEYGMAGLKELESKGWKIDEEAGQVDGYYILYDCEQCYSNSEKCHDEFIEHSPDVEKICIKCEWIDLDISPEERTCSCDCHVHCKICGTLIIDGNEPEKSKMTLDDLERLKEIMEKKQLGD